MPVKVSVLILAKNEEKNIADCIKSVAFADEVIVIDSGSSDKTQEIATSLGARVIPHAMDETGFAGQRNFALEQTDADWVLYLDADERITAELASEIQRHIEQKKQAVGAIQRLNVVMGQLMYHGVYAPDYVVRLFPRNKVHWEGVVHEHANTELSIIKFKKPAHHYCLTSWEQYFRKFDEYTTLMAEKMHQKGKHTKFFVMHMHAIFAFIRMYIFKLGFLDGKLGFILCQYHYFYTLTKYVKLYYLDKTNEHVGDEK